MLQQDTELLRRVQPVGGSPGEVDTAVGKALAILDAFGADPAPCSLQELARRAGLAKSTVYRVLQHLASWGAVTRRADSPRWQLGFRLLELGTLVHQQLPFRDLALPHLLELAVASRATASLAVRRDMEVLYLDRFDSQQGVTRTSYAGTRGALHGTAAGKVFVAYTPKRTGLERTLLARGLEPLTPYTIVVPSLFRAEIDAVRENGVALEREESALGTASVAATVVDASGQAVAVIAASMPMARIDFAQLARKVKATASVVSRDLVAVESS
jgi:DNA-binding IclR family transcriptional regulator